MQDQESDGLRGVIGGAEMKREILFVQSTASDGNEGLTRDRKIVCNVSLVWRAGEVMAEQTPSCPWPLGSNTIHGVRACFLPEQAEVENSKTLALHWSCLLFQLLRLNAFRLSIIPRLFSKRSDESLSASNP